MLALLLIAPFLDAGAPDVVERCAAQARRHARVTAETVAEACAIRATNGQMLASCQRVLIDGGRVAALIGRGAGDAAGREARRVDGHLRACRAGALTAEG